MTTTTIRARLTFQQASFGHCMHASTAVTVRQSVGRSVGRRVTRGEPRLRPPACSCTQWRRGLRQLTDERPVALSADGSFDRSAGRVTLNVCVWVCVCVRALRPSKSDSRGRRRGLSLVWQVADRRVRPGDNLFAVCHRDARQSLQRPPMWPSRTYRPSDRPTDWLLLDSASRPVSRPRTLVVSRPPVEHLDDRSTGDGRTD